MQKPNPAELLGIRGVAELEENRLDEREMAELQSEILETFAQAGEALQQDRQAEGEKLRRHYGKSFLKLTKLSFGRSRLQTQCPSA